jgi:regulator of sirC expression with transglutaminase-like and TPR domain
MNLDDTLPRLARHPHADLDLAELALWLARDEYPDLDIAEALDDLAVMAGSLRPRLRGSLAARVDSLGRYLFDELDFQGNTQEYYDAQNSYFNRVLARRRGIPITLSLLAMTVGRRAGLTVLGVGLPGHFVAKAVEGGEEEFFDPFHRGRRLTPAQCAELVAQVTGAPFAATPQALAAATPRAMVTRMLTNLKGIYLTQADFPRAARVTHRLVQLNPNDPLQRRDLGASLLRAEQPGPALAHLTAYLEAAPDAGDRPAVEGLIAQARRELTRWN